ncbi:MAG: NAD-dependent epimerase/dehydratase family protein [Bacteroidales bacterium]|nr:NAD-dependent epimerase/dehydratase family protein [Bacteroidales bacterium]
MKRILIYGKGSYIGEHFREGLEFEGHIVEMIDSYMYKPGDFSVAGYDVVINVVGIAHIKIAAEMEPLFYKINTEYAVDLARLCKEQGVGHYLYMSSMNVYGDTSERICSRDQENPVNFYGKSKWLADQNIHRMEDEHFKVASIRPPVVYGQGCKGNFNALVKVAKLSPVFPKFNNIRSMIYIDHLTNFVCQLVRNGEGGYFHPQNGSYISTTEAVVEIRRALGKKTLLIPGFNWAIRLLMKCSHTAERAFSNDYYDLTFSQYADNSYCLLSFSETIRRTI